MPSTKSRTSDAIVAYVPALHAGYLTFFKKYSQSDLYVLGATLLSLMPRLERDVRALSPEDALRAVRGLNLFSTVSILEKGSARKILSSYKKIILPDEDISRSFVATFLKGRKVSFEKIFLRWDGHSSRVHSKVPPDRVVSTSSKDLRLLRRAAKEATRSPDWWRQIGAVLVKGKKIVLTAYNRHLPSDASLAILGDPRSNFDYGEYPELYTSIHAEADIVAQAARAGMSLKGSELFVTTFPCSNCARLLVRAGVHKVFYSQGYSSLDAEDILKRAGVRIILVKGA